MYREPEADELHVCALTVGATGSTQPLPEALFTTPVLVTWAEAQA
jgi:hypothetical protein